MNVIYNTDCLTGLRSLPDECVSCCVTSPPYYALRDYGVDGQIGLEETPEEYIGKLVDVFREVKRVLRKDGTLWVNIGDSYWGGGWRGYAFNEHSECKQCSNKGSHDRLSIPKLKGNKIGIKDKDLIGIPFMLAFALRADGWYLRQDIIWHKPNPMPESVTDRCTKSHEYIFLLSKEPRYYFDYQAIQEEAVTQIDHRIGTRVEYDGKRQAGTGTRAFISLKTKDGVVIRNKRDVWCVPTKAYREAHFAMFPEKLIADCIKAGSRENGVVLDPFMGSGTTAIVARKLNRKYIGFELSKEYVKIANERLKRELGLFI